jgi:hypothetical protein
MINNQNDGEGYLKTGKRYGMMKILSTKNYGSFLLKMCKKFLTIVPSVAETRYDCDE